MPIFPNHSEVLVSKLDKSEVLERLQKVTKIVNFLEYNPEKNNAYQFNGSLDNKGFRISLIIQKADSFLPLIKGKVESTPSGSILFIDYSLFPSSAFFLGFWSFMTLIFALIFYFLVDNAFIAILSASVGIGNYLFAWAIFKRKITISQRIFLSILNN